MDMDDSCDVVVIGGGPAGEVAAGRLGENGLDVVLVEDRLVGGECSFWACMPSKALLRPAEALREVRRIPGAAEAVTGSLDVTATLRRRDEVIHDLDDSGMLPWLEERNVRLVRGVGNITQEKTVVVEGGPTLTARQAVIVATGSLPAMPPIPGLDEVRAWTNREATTTKQVPASLVVLGGGVVGTELAQAWRSLGSDVTLIEGLNRLISREEPFACEQVTDALTQMGVDIRTGRKAVAARREAGLVVVELDDGSTASGEQLLVAVGRRPASDCVAGIGLKAGEAIEVDEHCRSTRFDWLYAVGDVNGRALLTHMGKYQARIAADHIRGRETAIEHGADGPASPRVIFTDPQVAAVGLTTALAEERGIPHRYVDVGTSTNAGGSFYGRNAPGSARLVIDTERNIVIGATITGAEVAEFIHAATIAVVAEVPLEKLWHAVPSFPTRSELWLRLLETAGL